jgi:hypothetical protein
VTVLPDHVDTFLRAIVRPDQPIGVRDVALLLGVHPNTVKRLAPSSLPYFTVGKRGDRRYHRDDVRAYIAARTETGEESAWVKSCQCSECKCPYPSKPGTERGGRLICWRCKQGRHA